MYEDSSDDEIVMGGTGKFVKIAPFNPRDIDLSKPPTNGEEFLQRVIVESRNTKSITVQINRRNISNEDVEMDTAPVPENKPFDKLKVLSKEWRNEQLDVFSQLRDKADGVKKDIKSGKTKVETINDTNLENEEYCHELITTNTCTKSLMMQLNQVSLDLLLDYICDSLNTKKYSIQDVGMWIYSIMVYLDEPLTPEMFSNIRTIAKHCIEMRSLTDKDDIEKLAPLNLFITLISIYFKQADLADPY